MANLITDFREAVEARLAVSFPDIEIVGGERTGVNRGDVPIACVFLPAEGLKRFERDGAMANIVLVVRYWPARSKLLTEDSPRSPAELEQAVWDLASCLEPVRATLPGVSSRLTFEIPSFEPDYDPAEWGVEVTLLGWTSNPAGAGA